MAEEADHRSRATPTAAMKELTRRARSAFVNTRPVIGADIPKYLTAAALFGIGCQFLFAASHGSISGGLQTFSHSVMVSLAASAAGAFLGFLFGVPRHPDNSGGNQKNETTIRANNNFQEISDWLTKILVGIGLVELKPIASGFGQLVSLASETLRFPDVYVASIVITYTVFGFVLAYIWTVRDYAREESEYLEQVYRISNQALAERAESALDNPNSSISDKKFWSDRLLKAVEERPLDKRIALVKSRYDSDFHFQLEEAIKTIKRYIAFKEQAGQRDAEYAEGLYYLACYKCREIEDQDARPDNPRVREVIENLRTATNIRKELNHWKNNDTDLQKLRKIPAFHELGSSP